MSQAVSEKVSSTITDILESFGQSLVVILFLLCFLFAEELVTSTRVDRSGDPSASLVHFCLFASCLKHLLGLVWAFVNAPNHTSDTHHR